MTRIALPLTIHAPIPLSAQLEDMAAIVAPGRVLGPRERDDLALSLRLAAHEARKIERDTAVIRDIGDELRRLGGV